MTLNRSLHKYIFFTLRDANASNYLKISSLFSFVFCSNSMYQYCLTIYDKGHHNIKTLDIDCLLLQITHFKIINGINYETNLHQHETSKHKYSKLYIIKLMTKHGMNSQ